MSRPESPAGNNDVNVNLKVDKDKIEQDVQTAKERAADLINNPTDDPTEPDDAVKDNVTSDDE
jgi:hypothetical protein